MACHFIALRLRHGAFSVILISTAEAARRLGVSRQRVRQMLDRGTLAGIRIEGLPRARYVDLDGEGTENDGVLLSVRKPRDAPG